MALEMVNELGDIMGLLVKDRQPVERVRPLLISESATSFSLVDTEDYWQASCFNKQF